MKKILDTEAQIIMKEFLLAGYPMAMGVCIFGDGDRLCRCLYSTVETVANEYYKVFFVQVGDEWERKSNEYCRSRCTPDKPTSWVSLKMDGTLNSLDRIKFLREFEDIFGNAAKNSGEL